MCKFVPGGKGGEWRGEAGGRGCTGALSYIMHNTATVSS